MEVDDGSYNTSQCEIKLENKNYQTDKQLNEACDIDESNEQNQTFQNHKLGKQRYSLSYKDSMNTQRRVSTQ